MRVIEPKHFNKPSKHKNKSKTWLIIPGILLAVVAVFASKLLRPKQNSTASNSSQTQQNSTTHTTPATNTPTGEFKQFTGEEFKTLYRSVAYPNTQQVNEPLSITGNEIADKRIRELAEKRGYKTTALPQGSIVKINEPRLENDDLLQPLAAEGWQSLKTAAAKDKIPLSIISAYRSPEYQRNLFMGRLIANGTTAKLIADGIGDAVIEKTLGMTAVPGYSRHHTGYTIDLWCEDGSKTFVNSSCYRWINQNNYLHAKESGWIPSYPAGTDLQGPEPEPWEYVWVGQQYLRD